MNGLSRICFCFRTFALVLNMSLEYTRNFGLKIGSCFWTLHKYLLIVAAEAAIDVCNHIVARQGGRAPEEYAECFAILADLKVVEPGLAQRLKKMARFRNLLVHLYWKVDNQRVYQIVQHDLGDLDSFRQQVSAWLTVG